MNRVIASLLLLAAIAAPLPARAALALLRTYDGAASGDQFGYSCVVVGDMDGDGIAEFAIGAPANDENGEDCGQVSIYRGGSPLPDAPTWVITGNPGERLGHALSWGDVDGDGNMDLIIGAPGRPESPATLTGRIVIAYGGDPLGARGLRTVPGTTPSGRFGWSVSGFGLGFGGFDPTVRVLVGAPEANDGAGEVHALGPGDPPPATRTFVLHGEVPGEHLGHSLADAGITRGFVWGPEFLVGAPDAPVPAAGAGRFCLYTYDAPDDTLPEVLVRGALEGEHLGSSVTGGLDTNPNYFEPACEYVAGAPDAGPGGIGQSGAAHVYSDQAAAFTYAGTVPADRLGSQVRLLLDVAGTWLPDLAVAEAGAIRVYTGPLTSGAPPVATLAAESPGDDFGHAISNSGKLRYPYGNPSPDPRNQFLVGAPGHDGKGRVYVYSDPTAPSSVDPGPPATRVDLAAPSPNPSHGGFAIAVTLPRGAQARLAVVDLAGREVARLHNGALGAGRTEFRWTPAASQAPGLYWAVLEADGSRAARRMIRVR